ncbi:MAG: PHP domain-containing protein, partial [Treponema sp.]|jgi:predicted metal-dependent phosphoesterase TrpH|nr:PHP domain-containing protein [Treponema sp.]
VIDLHAHSCASDGDLSPRRLFETARDKGIRALALTDHDTIAGLDEAGQAAGDCGVQCIPGVELEISAEDSGFSSLGFAVRGEFHLLGLGLRFPSGRFVETLNSLKAEREKRNRLILEKMRAAGIEVSYADIEAFAGGVSGPVRGAIVGRPHFGAFLISRKIVRSQEQAFKRYLGKGRPFYVQKKGLSFPEAAALIHESGGIAVLAHPMSLYLSWGRLPGFLACLKELRLDGVEAWHPATKVKTCKRLEELGRSLGLYITAGSDFHGSARPERKLGCTAGGGRIEDRFLEVIPPLQLSDKMS